MKRAAIYLRVSTGEQTTENQRIKLEEALYQELKSITFNLIVQNLDCRMELGPRLGL